MTTPGGGGPIETAYVEIKPKVDPKFAADLRKQIMPHIKKVSKEAERAFQQIGASSKTASSGVSGLSRSLSGASKSAANFAKNAQAASGATGALNKAAGTAQRNLRSVGGAADHAGRGARNAGTQFNFLARALIVGAVYAAGKALKDLGNFGIGAAAQLEQTKIAFTGLFGSAADAEAFTKRLQKFAAATPFEFEGVAKASQRLLALGQTGDEAIKTLTTVGNAAAAVGADETSINRVIVALAQIQAKGKLSAEEINQVGEALPNLNRGKVIENLAESFGVTEAKIREMQQKGLIPAEAGVAALLKTLQEVPGAMGAMDRQSKTLIGRFSTFKDTIKANFSNALESSLPVLGDSLLRLTDTISTQLETFAPALGESLVAITPLVEGFVNLIGPLLTGLLTTLSPILAQLAVAFGPIGDAITTVLDALGPALVPLAAALAQVGVAIAPVAAALGVQLANALVALTPLIIRMTNVFIPFLNYLAAHPTLLGDLAIGFIAVKTAMAGYSIIDKVVSAVKALGVVTFIQTAAQQGLNAALRANPIGAIITAVTLLVTGFVLLYRHSETFRKGIGHLRDFAVTAFRFLVNAWMTAVGVLVKGAAFAFGWIPGIGGRLKQAASQVDQFKDSINASLDKITRQVDINIVTHTYTIAEQTQNNRAAARQARINKGLRALGPHGTITAEDRAAVEAQVDAAIAAENKAAQTQSKKKPAKTPGKPEFLSPAGGAASGAKKAASAVQKAMVKLADSALKAAKKVADGIKSKLTTARDALKKLRDQFEDIRKAIVDAFSVDLFASRSAKQFIKRAAKNIANNTTVLASQRTLQAAVGNEVGGSEFLRKLFESGNSRLIKNLASQSTSTIREVLAKFNEDNELANKIGIAVAGAYRVENRPLVVGIASVRLQVISLEKALVAALAKVEAATKARERLKTAAGGIFTAATDLQVGEAGREVVVPLTRPARALELLLKSGALGLPTVAAHLGDLQDSAQSQSAARLRALGVPSTPTGARSPQNGVQASPPALKVVKERTVNQTFNINGSKDPRLTAAAVAARTASHMDR